MFPKIGAFVVNGPQGAPWVERRLVVLSALSLWGSTTSQLYQLLQHSREAIPSLPILSITLNHLLDHGMVRSTEVEVLQPRFWEITPAGQDYLEKSRAAGWTPALRESLR